MASSQSQLCVLDLNCVDGHVSLCGVACMRLCARSCVFNLPNSSVALPRRFCQHHRHFSYSSPYLVATSPSSNPSPTPPLTLCPNLLARGQARLYPPPIGMSRQITLFLPPQNLIGCRRTFDHPKKTRSSSVLAVSEFCPPNRSRLLVFGPSPCHRSWPCFYQSGKI